MTKRDSWRNFYLEVVNFTKRKVYLVKNANFLKVRVGNNRFNHTIISLFLFFSILLTPTVLAQTPTFLIDDVYPYNASGSNNVTVRICSNTNTTAVNSFNFSTSLSGGFANVSVVNATITQCGGNLHRYYYNTTNYTGNLSLVSKATCDASQQLEPLVQPPFPQCADFALNVTWADTGAVINVTSFNETYNQSSLNASVVTINQYIVKTQSPQSSSGLGNVVLMGFNDTVNDYANFSQGPAVSDSTGYWIQHCRGTVAADGSCIGQTQFHPSNQCIWHGLPFFAGSQVGAFGMEGGSNNCLQLNNSVFVGYDFVSSNSSRGRVLFNQTATITMNTSTVISFVDTFKVSLANPFGGFGSEGFLNLSSIKVYNSTGVVLAQTFGGVDRFVPPAFLDVNAVYTIELNISGTPRNYSFISTSNGIYGAIIQVADTTGVANPSFTIIKGQIVNASNPTQGVAGAVVYAKLHDYFSPPMGIVFINSTVADQNGIFSLRVPSTSFISEPFGSGVMPFPAYDLFIVSNITNPTTGAPVYFPTIDKNGEMGYFAQGANTILKPIKLGAGGQVNVNVTLNNATGLLSELSRFESSKVTGETRDAFTSKMTMLKIFDQVTLPKSITVPLTAPSGNVQLLVLGQNQSFGFSDTPPVGICINTTTVTQGQISNVNCNLTQPGFLNLNVTNCQSIFNSVSCNVKETLGNFHFWFENRLVVTNSSGNSLTYIDGASFLLENILRGGTSYQNLSIPLPDGSYQLRIEPRLDFSRFASVKNTTAFAITAGQTLPRDINRTERFQIEPRFQSLVLSANNNVNISVRDGTGTPLNTTHVNVTAQLLYPNRSAAGTSAVLNLAYDPTAQIFYNRTANFSAAAYGGMTAGKYLLLVNATNVSGSSSYTSTFTMPVSLSDFSVGINLGGFTFGTGQLINGKVYAFDTTTNPPTGVASGQLRIEIQDSTGAPVNSTNASSGIVDGEGSFSLLAPSTVGFYNLAATVNGSGKSGTAETWLQVSNLAIKLSTDRFSYQPSDNVIVSVEVRNASSSAGIANANVEVTVDSNRNPITGITDSNGKATLTLNPSQITGSTWSFGFHSIKVKISKDTATQVINLESFYGFEVRGIEAFVETEKPSYSTTDTVKVNVFVPPSTTLSSNPTAVLDGLSNVTYTANQSGPGFYQFDLGTRQVGRHSVKVTVSTSGGSQDIFTGFEVISTNIQVETRRGATLEFKFNANELLNLSVKVINSSTGQPVSSKQVVVTLYKVSPPNDINVSHNNTYNYTNTSTQGIAQLFLNVGNRSGPHYAKVLVDNQVQYAGIMVSSLSVSLMNATPGTAGAAIVNSFTGTPGTTVNIYVNASSGGGFDVADGSIVTLRLWAFGRPTEITNTTTKGNATLSIEIPSFAPKLTYGLDVSVSTSDGSAGFAPPASLTVTGSNALRLSVEPNKRSYSPSSSGSLVATLTYENGTGAVGYNISFERGAPGRPPSSLGSANTNAGGISTLSVSNMGSTDGEYFVHAFITNDTSLTAYSGYIVNGLVVRLSTNKTTYNVGEAIGFNVTVTNSSSGTSVNASGGTGFISIFDEDRGIITTPLTVGNSQPYTASLSIPNDSSSIGTFGAGVEFTFNGSKGFDFALISVANSSEIVNISIPTSITAGEAFSVTIFSSATSTARLGVFSPVATSVVYDNSSIAMTANTPQNVTVNITDTGIYVFMLRVNNVGGNSTVRSVTSVASGTTAPAVWSGSSLTTNSSAFSTGGTVFIISNTANSTARVLTTSNNITTTVSLPLTQTSGSRFYNTFTPSVAGTYYVRLDKSTSSGVASAMFVVS
ncbi:MAG: hypothetical protein HYT70_03795 [Candidatus Aenigmarchaeota archaeon]|nr:hypothetical protein [Candidatus Aenigmarchaeota archaeon]